MAFTYSDALTLDRDKVRLRIGDTLASAGPRPDKRNYSDAEISFFLTDEGNVINGAVAAAFETLAGEWSAYALSDKEGEAQFDAKEVAAGYRAQAVIWRKKPAGGSDGGELEAGVINLGFMQTSDG